MMKVAAIIQARTGSTRLPGKVLLDIAGESMLARVVRRAQSAQTLDSVIVATSELSADDAIAKLCRQREWPCFRGSETDVLDRYYHAAREYGAQSVVRITSDCPFVDPALVDELVELFRKQRADYASVGLPRSYPRGLDCEVMTMEALSRAWKEAREGYQRIHVTPYLYEHREIFYCAGLTADRDYSGHRWTVDTWEDLEFARAVYQRLGGSNEFAWRDVLRIVEKQPELAELNGRVPQKALREG